MSLPVTSTLLGKYTLSFQARLVRPAERGVTHQRGGEPGVEHVGSRVSGLPPLCFSASVSLRAT